MISPIIWRFLVLVYSSLLFSQVLGLINGVILAVFEDNMPFEPATGFEMKGLKVSPHPNPKTLKPCPIII